MLTLLPWQLPRDTYLGTVLQRFAPAVALLLAPVVGFAESRAYPPTIKGAREEVYKTVDDVDLRLWIVEPRGQQHDDSRPAIVFFFGGGWKSGSPKQFEQHCRYFASRGMVAITADYRVRSRHGTLADRAVADAKSAIRFVRANAGRLGVDPNRIVAAGGSAGGHLAACTGVVPGLDEESEDQAVSSVPNALALFNPAVVLAPHDQVSLDPETLSNLSERTGVQPKKISPIHHVRDGLPPTIIFHGEDDTTVPFSSVNAYAKSAEAAGNRCELKGFADAGHGFFNYGRGGTPGAAYQQTVQQLDQFLVSLGYLPERE